VHRESEQDKIFEISTKENAQNQIFSLLIFSLINKGERFRLHMNETRQIQQQLTIRNSYTSSHLVQSSSTLHQLHVGIISILRLHRIVVETVA